jgi:hypothetical protein
LVLAEPEPEHKEDAVADDADEDEEARSMLHAVCPQVIQTAAMIAAAISPAVLTGPPGAGRA